MKISARKYAQRQGQEEIKGPVSTEVLIELSDGVEVVSVITKESAEMLNLAPGKEVYPVIKATNVMIAED